MGEIIPLPGSGEGLGHRHETPPAVDPQDTDGAAAMAQHLLAISDRSRDELRRRLLRGGYAPETAAEALDRLEARGWVDDGRLAEELTRRRLSHGYGRRRVLADLAARGVDPQTVSRTGEALAAGQAAAVRVAAERLRRSHRGPPDAAEVIRLAGALQRRGFDSSDIRSVLREMASEVTLPPDDGE
jgi:regulatory protein